MAFEFTNSKGNAVSMEQNPLDLIALRFQEEPVSWYNSSNKNVKTIAKLHGIAYPKLMELRRSPEFKVVAEEYLSANGEEVNDKNLELAGVLGEKRKVVKHDPRASKHIIWGEIVRETDDEVVIRKYPPIENEFANKSKRELVQMVLEARDDAKIGKYVDSEDAVAHVGHQGSVSEVNE